MPIAALVQPKPQTAYGFTLWKHGNLPVYKEQNKWVIHHPDGSAEEYSSGRALMRGLHNGRDPHLPVDRYFKKKGERLLKGIKSGAYQPTTLDIFGVEEPLKLNDNEVGIKLGIDLANRGHEVRKLLYAGFGKKIVAMGYEPEDVLQDVYAGLLARNKGKCPWDIRKSSFGHYVHMVCGCILSNYHRKYNRINMNERTGVRTFDDGSFVEIDLAASNLCRVRSDQGDSIDEGDLLQEVLAIVASQGSDVLIDKKWSRRDTSLQVVPMLVQGWKRREISSELGIREGVITRCINHIRQLCSDTFRQ